MANYGTLVLMGQGPIVVARCSHYSPPRSVIKSRYRLTVTHLFDINSVQLCHLQSPAHRSLLNKLG
jgi:hypothetical protein